MDANRKDPNKIKERKIKILRVLVSDGQRRGGTAKETVTSRERERKGNSKRRRANGNKKKNKEKNYT